MFMNQSRKILKDILQDKYDMNRTLISGNTKDAT